jgi:pimeloyl-ACP methyl ester carboxylesterase
MNITVSGPTGTHTAYAYTGGKAFNPALPCVVFVHGALHDHSGFTLLARWFAHHGHSVLAVDLPGHMRSEGPPPASIEDAATWLLQLLAAVGVQRAALVGHSMGSLICLQAAAMAPQLASHLVMVGTANPMPVGDALLATAASNPQQAIKQVNTYSIATMAGKPSFPGPGMWLHGANAVLMRRVQAHAQQQQGINLFAHDFGVCNAYSGGEQAAQKVQCPTTLVLGAQDQMTLPKGSMALAALLQARVHTLPGTGHHLMAEAPDGVLAAVRSALSVA